MLVTKIGTATVPSVFVVSQVLCQSFIIISCNPNDNPQRWVLSLSPLHRVQNRSREAKGPVPTDSAARELAVQIREDVTSYLIFNIATSETTNLQSLKTGG